MGQTAGTLEDALTYCDNNGACTHVTYNSTTKAALWHSWMGDSSPGTTSMIMTEAGHYPQYNTIPNADMPGTEFISYQRARDNIPDAPSCAAQCMTVWAPGPNQPLNHRGYIATFNSNSGTCKCKTPVSTSGTNTYVRRVFA